MGTWAHRWLYEDFWVLVWPNVGAVPLCAAAGSIGVWCFRRPLERAWKRFRGHLHEPLRAELAEIREMARKAHQISADTYRLHAGHDHPDAPGGGTDENQR